MSTEAGADPVVAHHVPPLLRVGRRTRAGTAAGHDQDGPDHDSGRRRRDKALRAGQVLPPPAPPQQRLFSAAGQSSRAHVQVVQRHAGRGGRALVRHSAQPGHGRHPSRPMRAARRQLLI